jgi:hypothetical protein
MATRYLIDKSAFAKRDADEIRDELRGFDWLPTPDEVWDRAAEVSALLIDTGNWRAQSIVDLVVTGVAERHRATVLHYEGDFDMIAAVTRQATQWVVPPGSVEERAPSCALRSTSRCEVISKADSVGSWLMRAILAEQ